MSRAHSNKAKGRKGQQEVQKLICTIFPQLEMDDCRSNPMGSGGEDILLSPAARKLIPYSIEVKRKKRIGACRFMEQAEGHGPHKPAAFFREDHGEWFACVRAKDLLELLRIISILESK
jgi:hypothetical protein